jgi:putative ABC transport system substrate-binding protein
MSRYTAGMDRRTFLGTISAVVFSVPLAAEAQTATDVERRRSGKLPVIGYLGSGYPSDRSSSRFAYLFHSFADGLRQLGYVDGQTVEIEWRWAEEQYERLPDLAADLVRLGVDVIFTPFDHSAVAARRATQTTPIVFLGAVAFFAGGN